MRIASLKLVAFAACVTAAPLAAQSPIQLSLFDPIQIVGDGSAVSGLRLSVLYAKNTNVSFIDLGMIYNLTTGNGSGIQWALVPRTQGSFTGWQNGFVSVSDGSFAGLQVGAVTLAKSGKGVQLGWINNASSWQGLQFGLLNMAGNMNGGGLQIGIINVIKQGGQFPVFPIVNWTF